MDYPQDPSPFVAELYRWWYRQRGLPNADSGSAAENRLFIESFVYLQPWWTLRLGLVPFWMCLTIKLRLSGLTTISIALCPTMKSISPNSPMVSVP
ncbi:MAG TPA: hypothetical protein V6C91_06485 [Coleofasciculaceae cyanobacterium]